MEPLELDHLVLPVADLDTAADLFEENHGLASVAGGRHPGRGTMNRIVPLGPNYLELLAVVDPVEAAASQFGRWALDSTESLGVQGVCFRTTNLDEVGERLGLSPTAMSRARPDGSNLSWRIAGMDGAIGPRRLPFFIEWNQQEDQPGRTSVDHQNQPAGITDLVLSGDLEELKKLVGDVPGVSLAEGNPGVVEATISTSRGPVTLPGAVARPAVLFACVHNAGRSQMAAGFMRELSNGRIDVFSGGSAPARSVNPAAVAAMAELGIDIAGQVPRRWDDATIKGVDVVVTMGCGDECPVFPGTRYLDWELEDPAGKPLEDVRPVRDEIEKRVRRLLSELG